jgi:hypothetical protein
MEQMTLGEMILFLRREKQDNIVKFDFCNFAPTSFHSYRGYYDQLAVGYEQCSWRDGESTTVKQFLEKCNEAKGGTFMGWKGGDFKMTGDTPVWVAESGETGGTAIINIKDMGYFTLIETKCID